jgi:outer membrane translocation and assembly module TamA
MKGTLVILALVSWAGTAFAQEPPPPANRQALIEGAQAAKAEALRPIVLSKAERVMNRVETILDNGLTWHPYFESAYQGGGLPFGLGYRRHVSPYNALDVRGSYTMRGYTRVEAEFTAPHLFRRRGQLSLLGGWRKATEVAFYGIGQDTASANRTSYGFRQPYASATLRLLTRRPWTVAGSAEWTTWDQRPGEGAVRSLDTLFTPQTLAGFGSDVTYIHSQATAGFDWRPFSGYARRGGYIGVTAHDYHDTNSAFGFNQIDYEAIQHVPILRETWVVTLRGVAQTTHHKRREEIPFFMLPSLGGGSTLRGFSSWRLRDRNSLLLQAEWRIMVNRFLDTAFFGDAGKVAAHPSDLDFDGLRHDWGVGFRFHSPATTVLRIDVARSGEGTRLIFAAGHVF